MLSVFRDGVLYSQSPLQAPLTRLGRTTENDVVLDDAARRVSREHAELRLSPDGIVLADLGSANGTFVNGEKVGEIAIKPGVPFTIGPYRLILEEVEDSAVPAPAGDSSVTWPEASEVNPPQPEPVRKSGDTTAHDGPRSAWLDWVRAHPLEVGLGGASFGVIALVLALVSASPSTRPPGDTEAVAAPAFDADATLREARARLQNGDVNGARSLVNDLLQRTPDHQGARALSTELEAMKPPSPPPAPDAPIAPLPAVPEPSTPPAETAATPEAAARPGASRRPPGEVPGPGFPLLGRLPRETEPQRVQRSRALYDRYGEALNALGQSDFGQAERLVESILQTEPRYELAAKLRERIQQERLDTAARLRTEGQSLRKQGDLARALSSLQQAHDVSPLPGLEQEISDTRRTMYEQAAAALEDADLLYARGRPSAELYKRACAYLDRTHPRRDQACERAKE